MTTVKISVRLPAKYVYMMDRSTMMRSDFVRKAVRHLVVEHMGGFK